MSHPRDGLIDHLLGELTPEQASRLEARLGSEPALAAEQERYRAALGLLRGAAALGWSEGRRQGRLLAILRPLAAVAALLLVAFVLFFMDGTPRHPDRVFEPAEAFGQLLPEELSADGEMARPSRVAVATLRTGSVEIGVLGATARFRALVDSPIPTGSEINTSAEGGARIDLPDGGILYMGPLATVHLRERENGRTALRVAAGVACTVAGSRPIHVAVDESDLLLVHQSGAALFRHSPADTVCLRGELLLDLDAKRKFRVPEGERLPAACVAEPQTVQASEDELGLDWYRALEYTRCLVDDMLWERPGVSVPLAPEPGTLLYLRLLPRSSGKLRLSFGGAVREFALFKDQSLELRLSLTELGPGPQIIVEPAGAIHQCRLFNPRAE